MVERHTTPVPFDRDPRPQRRGAASARTRRIDAFLKTQPYTAEVVVVENGSVDRTFEVAQEYASRLSYVRPIQVDTRGKGLAVKAGMLAAQGEYRFICDTDLSMPIEDVVRFLPPQTEGATRDDRHPRGAGQ
ncbi:MAG: glycosyltransferase [Chloroflexi bacterium]|nr:glycosyltransferase [Chloroflexota bacterium]